MNVPAPRFQPGLDQVDVLARLTRSLARLGCALDWQKSGIPSGKKFFQPADFYSTHDYIIARKAGEPLLFRRAHFEEPSPLKRFFVYGETLSEDPRWTEALRSQPEMPPWDDLVAHAIVTRLSAGRVRAGIRLVPLFDRWFVADPAWDLSEDAVYIGQDSVRLACTARTSLRGHVLDAYAGTGVQGILASPRAVRVTIAELNPRALAMARINLALAGVRNAAIVQADSLTAVRSRFHVVLLNPPYGAVSLASRALARSHGGGLLGDEETIRAIELLEPLIGRHESAFIVGTFPCVGMRPRLFDLVSGGLDIRFNPESISQCSSEWNWIAGMLVISGGNGRRQIGDYPLTRRVIELSTARLRALVRG